MKKKCQKSYNLKSPMWSYKGKEVTERHRGLICFLSSKFYMRASLQLFSQQLLCEGTRFLTDCVTRIISNLNIKIANREINHVALQGDGHPMLQLPSKWNFQESIIPYKATIRFQRYNKVGQECSLKLLQKFTCYSDFQSRGPLQCQCHNYQF